MADPDPIEALLAILDPRWIARLEVPVYRPVRGVIDVTLQDRQTADVVAGEAHSRLHVVEHQLRWAGQKADALPSTRDWPWSDADEAPRISRLLLLRSTSAARDLVRSLPETFRIAYPASSAAAFAALTSGSVRWPGSAILWVDVNGSATRVMPGHAAGARSIAGLRVMRQRSRATVMALTAQASFASSVVAAAASVAPVVTTSSMSTIQRPETACAAPGRTAERILDVGRPVTPVEPVLRVGRAIAHECRLHAMPSATAAAAAISSAWS